MARGAAQRVVETAKNQNRAKKQPKPQREKLPTIEEMEGIAPELSTRKFEEKFEEVNVLLAIAMRDGIPIRKLRLDRGGLMLEGAYSSELLHPTYQGENGDFVKTKHDKVQAWLIPQGVLLHFRDDGRRHAEQRQQLELVPLSKCLQISLVP